MGRAALLSILNMRRATQLSLSNMRRTALLNRIPDSSLLVGIFILIAILEVIPAQSAYHYRLIGSLSLPIRLCVCLSPSSPHFPSPAIPSSLPTLSSLLPSSPPPPTSPQPPPPQHLLS